MTPGEISHFVHEPHRCRDGCSDGVASRSARSKRSNRCAPSFLLAKLVAGSLGCLIQ
jgi:hypothetical protein